MRTFSESNVLLNTQGALPVGFNMAVEEFYKGWNVVRTGGTRRIEKKIRTLGWSLIQLAQGVLRSGVGKTEQKAVANALNLAVRNADAGANLMEVEHIEVSDYPWFFLARVRVGTYRIQEGADLDRQEEKAALPLNFESRVRLEAQDRSESASAVPMMKQMVLASRVTAARA